MALWLAAAIAGAAGRANIVVPPGADDPAVIAATLFPDEAEALAALARQAHMPLAQAVSYRARGLPLAEVAIKLGLDPPAAHAAPRAARIAPRYRDRSPAAFEPVSDRVLLTAMQCLEEERRPALRSSEPVPEEAPEPRAQAAPAAEPIFTAPPDPDPVLFARDLFPASRLPSQRRYWHASAHTSLVREEPLLER